ncbi:acyl carrier protein [Streptomyces specialis]|uniref:acyl carrier protein n=1 Tax=Streptomyces specialis TaxID=498367 RepID=UPI00073E81E0|nr:acyl carrier protein [Streptomyces specialis]
MSTTDQRVRRLLADEFGIPADAIGADRRLRELALDSLALEELRTMAEECFDIDLTDARISAHDTFGALVHVIDSARADA